VDLDLPVCVTCGVQYAGPREDCPICEDERQYVGWDGQQWTSLRELAESGHTGRIEAEGPGVVGIGVEPSVGIGQRALLISAGSDNVLWDSVPYLDDAMVQQVEDRGGIRAVAVSHPHFYGAMVEWAHEFSAPVYVHAADRDWLPRPDPAVTFWDGDSLDIGDGLTLVNLGVHFAGGQVLHSRDAESGGGALFSGDIVQVVSDRRWVSFMYSYPNLIPERPAVVRRAASLLEPFRFERVYGGWWRRNVASDGTAAVRRSAERYLQHIRD
jgi:glyoxylase-like metal-dependent hydrolase (beta-lactamase superfamily II)